MEIGYDPFNYDVSIARSDVSSNFMKRLVTLTEYGEWIHPVQCVIRLHKTFQM